MTSRRVPPRLRVQALRFVLAPHERVPKAMDHYSSGCLSAEKFPTFASGRQGRGATTRRRKGRWPPRRMATAWPNACSVLPSLARTRRELPSSEMGGSVLILGGTYRVTGHRYSESRQAKAMLTAETIHYVSRRSPTCLKLPASADCDQRGGELSSNRCLRGRKRWIPEDLPELRLSPS